MEQTVSRFTRLQRVINRLIRPVVKLQRAFKYSLRGSRVSLPLNLDPAPSPFTQGSGSPGSITGNASYISHKKPAQSQSLMATSFESVDGDLEDDHGSFRDLAQYVDITTPRISVTEVDLEDQTHPLSMTTLAAHATVSHSPSASDAPDNSSLHNSSPQNTQERNLTGCVHLHPSRQVYDGPYSAVFQGVYKEGDDEKDVAIKIVRAVGSPHSIRRRRRREVTTGMSLHHPNILPVYGIVEGDGFGPFGGIVTPWCPNGNAAQLVHGYNLLPLERYRLWRGVLDGLAYLHSQSPQIAHGDMKPPNVLIAKDGRPMICDLGLARFLIDDGSSSRNEYKGDEICSWFCKINTTTPHSGTPRYLAPEQVDPNRPSKPTMAADVFAVGCIGFEFIYSTLPYANRLHNFQGQIFYDIRRGIPPAYRPITAYSSKITSSSAPIDGVNVLWEILEWCWRLDPSSRPTALRLCELLTSYEDVIVSALEGQI
ncbi:SubName: Full=Uncharacterized protein {ECO:0000313/EMBL:CCA75953.1} [Serendipita indica DSM 11827]|uniref:Protein kinase domain-containing protein n=1 Tax=Serendipita indica (strain DSM 11827) TaxID=1109443 RepID=G4TXB0_SERID|nr:SubName: Full=Uncharacterized protein {ECO:0000313/EMBL:CCA75953.1} [Serendipita indica DSM 11827]CCA75953.1 hypothetical protein PIIN_09949 [Serendipita indica DSM 11827]